jgi:hypothetical protein
MPKTFEAQVAAFVTVEAETEEEATKQVLAWQDAVAAGSAALAALENKNDIVAVEFALDEIGEIDDANPPS